LVRIWLLLDRRCRGGGVVLSPRAPRLALDWGTPLWRTQGTHKQTRWLQQQHPRAAPRNPPAGPGAPSAPLTCTPRCVNTLRTTCFARPHLSRWPNAWRICTRTALRIARRRGRNSRIQTWTTLSWEDTLQSTGSVDRMSCSLPRFTTTTPSCRSSRPLCASASPLSSR